MIKAVLFDLDGTLLDRDASLKKFIDSQYNRLHPFLSHIPKEDYKKRFVELDSRGYVWKDRVYRQLIDEFKIVGITWEQLLDDYLTQFKHHCVPFPNLIELLEYLKSENIKLGMITNGYTSLQYGNIKALGIEKYFKTIVISEQEGIKKPDSEIFIRALKRLGSNATESMYVGDHPINDVQASKLVGMRGVWKRDCYWNSPVEADFIIDDLLELEHIVNHNQSVSLTQEKV